MKRVPILVLALMILIPIALAETVLDTIPDTSQWGISRTRFRESTAASFQELEVNGLKVLYASGLDVSGNNMDAYYKFGSKQGNYYGLSKVLYLLDVKKRFRTPTFKRSIVTWSKRCRMRQPLLERPIASGSMMTARWRSLLANLQITTDRRIKL